MEETVFYKCDFSSGTVYLFSEYHNLIDDGYVFGKPIYVKKNTYSFSTDRLKTKNLPDGVYFNLAYRKMGDEFENVSDYEMRDIAISEFPLLEKRDGIFDNYAFVRKEFVTKTYFPKEGLTYLRKINSDLDETAKKLQNLFSLNDDEIGITGSISIGATSFGDYDFVFYGNNKKLAKIKEIIDNLTATNDGAVYENGLFWKARFNLGEKLVCCFFNYNDYLAQLKELVDSSLSDEKTFSGICDGNDFALSKNAYFKLKESEFDSVIILSNMFKNAINSGDSISGKCFSAILANGEKIAVVKNPQQNLNDSLKFFKQ